MKRGVHRRRKRKRKQSLEPSVHFPKGRSAVTGTDLLRERLNR